MKPQIIDTPQSFKESVKDEDTAKPTQNTVQSPAPLTPADFAKALDLLENRIPEDADHTKFGIVANKLTNRLMNFKKRKTEFNPYTR